MNQEASHIILFDGVCNLCNGAVQFIIKHDPTGKFKFASLQSDIGQALLRQSGLTAGALDSLLYLRNGKYFTRSSAALEIARDMDGWRKLIYGLKIIPRLLRDFIYDLIARNRYRVFGKSENCIIPPTGIKDRFLF